MASVPVLKPSEVVRTFEKLGWEVVRQRGSHIILTKQGNLATLSNPKNPVSMGEKTDISLSQLKKTGFRNSYRVSVLHATLN
jgi:predicted RNA binding protein YcfA (HicA-like mRNA interferase family)